MNSSFRRIKSIEQTEKSVTPKRQFVLYLLSIFECLSMRENLTVYFLRTALLLSHYIPQSYSADFWSALILFSPNFNLPSVPDSPSPHTYMYSSLGKGYCIAHGTPWIRFMSPKAVNPLKTSLLSHLTPHERRQILNSSVKFFQLSPGISFPVRWARWCSHPELSTSPLACVSCPPQ